MPLPAHMRQEPHSWAAVQGCVPNPVALLYRPPGGDNAPTPATPQLGARPVAGHLVGDDGRSSHQGDDMVSGLRHWGCCWVVIVQARSLVLAAATRPQCRPHGARIKVNTIQRRTRRTIAAFIQHLPHAEINRRRRHLAVAGCQRRHRAVCGGHRRYVVTRNLARSFGSSLKASAGLGVSYRGWTASLSCASYQTPGWNIALPMGSCWLLRLPAVDTAALRGSFTVVGTMKSAKR